MRGSVTPRSRVCAGWAGAQPLHAGRFKSMYQPSCVGMVNALPVTMYAALLLNAYESGSFSRAALVRRSGVLYPAAGSKIP